MTYIKPQLDTDVNIIPGEDIEILARKIAAAGQKQVAEDIARLKAVGEPIHYLFDRKLIKELAKGEKFEIEIQEDGSEKIIGKII
jgi:hypothetical protein